MSLLFSLGNELVLIVIDALQAVLSDHPLHTSKHTLVRCHCFLVPIRMPFFLRLVQVSYAHNLLSSQVTPLKMRGRCLNTVIFQRAR